MSTYPAWPAFVCALLALFAKTTATSVLQVASRLRARTFLLPEDAAMLGVKPVAEEAAFVRRCAGVWRNDVENVPLFLALAFCWTLSGAGAFEAWLLFGLYAGLRWLHTAAFLAGLQPWRAILYLSGLAVCWTIAARLAWRVLGPWSGA